MIGEWCQISGGIEDGEKAWEAAPRDVKEETGLNCDRLYSADICEQFYEVGRDAISMLPVFVGFVDAGAAVVINGEHSEFRWVSFEEALRMVYRPELAAVAPYIRLWRNRFPVPAGPCTTCRQARIVRAITVRVVPATPLPGNAEASVTIRLGTSQHRL